MPNPNPFPLPLNTQKNLSNQTQIKFMDSISDLSLLEIAAEDDSLLLDVPASTDVFSCSPLISLRSNPRLTEGNGSDVVDSENSANKENANWSKPEAMKLSVERQQMKRKKKGGYNLRKSLAWDRAFFTEQGVLNATELSMISGTATSNADLNLEVIQEEEPASTSLALQEIEENLFKQSSDNVPIEDKIIARSGLYPKQGASVKNSPAPASLAKRKVLAVNDAVGNRSKRSACPRPVASSLLRRPDPVKVPSRETKVSRTPGTKPNVSVCATTARSGTLGTGSSKRNPNARPVSATRVQKNAGIKGLSKNPKTAQSNPKVDPNDNLVARTLTKQDGKHLDNSVSETHPPSRLHQPGTGANKVSERLPLGVSDNAEKRQQTQFQTSKPSGLRMPSPSLGFFSEAKTLSQLQKSSKISKPAESNIPKLKKSETISVNEKRLPHPPSKRPETVEGAARNCNSKLIHSVVKSEPCIQVDNEQIADAVVEGNSLVFENIISKQEKVENIPEHVGVKSDEQGELHQSKNVTSMECVSFPIHEKKLLSKSVTHEHSDKEADQPSMQVDNEQMADVEVEFTSSGSERISMQQKLQQGELRVGVKSDEQGDLHKSENVSSMEDAPFPIHGKTLLSKSVTQEQTEKEAYQPSMLVDNKQMADVEVECNSSGSERISEQEKVENIIEPVSVKSTGHGEVHKSENFSRMEDVLFASHENKFLSKSLTHEQSEEETDRNLDDRAYDVMSSGDKSVFPEPHSMHYHGNQQTSTGEDRTSNTLYNAMEEDEDEQLKESSSAKSALLNCSPADFSEAVLDGSIQGISFKITEQMDSGTGDFGMSEGDAQVHLLNGNLPISCNETTQSNLEEVNQQLHGEQFMTPNPSIVGEISSEKENESHVNSFQQVHVTTLSSKVSPENSMLDITGASENESKLVEIEDFQLPADGQSGFIQKIPTNEGYGDQAIDSEAIDDRTQVFELDRFNEDSTAISATACGTEILSVSPEIEDFQLPVDGQSGFIQKIPMDERYGYQAIESEAIDDRTQVFELDRLNEDSTAVSATACSTEILSVSPENRPFCDGSNIENLHLICRPCPSQKADFDSRGIEPQVNSCQLIHMRNLSSKGSPEMTIPETKGASESDSKLVETEDCQLQVDGQSGFGQAIPMDEGNEQVIDSKAVDDTTQVFESDKLSVDCTSVSATACCTIVMEVSRENIPFCENKVESPHLTSQLCPMLKADNDARGNDMSFNNYSVISELKLRGDGSSRDTSLHCDNQCNVPGSSEQQASMFTFSETNEMLHEGESLVPYHGHLIDQSELSEASKDFISKPSDSIGSRTENPSALLQHTVLVHSVQEYDHINREIEGSLVEGAQLQSSNENTVAHNAVNHDHFSLAGDNNMNEDVDEWLPTNVASPGEIKKENVFECASEGCNIQRSEHTTTNIQAVPENKDGNLNVGGRAELVQIDGAKGSSSDKFSLVEVHNIISDEFDSSEKVSKDPSTEEVEKSEEHSFLSETSNVPDSDYINFNVRIPQDSEGNSLNSEKILDEAETIIFEKDEFPNTSMLDNTEGDIYSAEDSSKMIHLSTTKSKQEAPKVEPPPNVAPFSDEWLAAIEAAGEEILTIKSGPVQNSPPEKPQHEPGPWSPVKRKNQVLGPFDCTKHTNIPHSSSQ